MPRRFSPTAPTVAGVGFGVAAGVFLGAFALGPVVSGNAGGGGAEVREEYRKVMADYQLADAQMGSGDSILSDLAPSLVDGTLAGRPVLVVRTSNAQDGDVAAVESLLKSADAEAAGTIDLANAFFESERADELKSLVATTLPAGAQLSTKKLDMGTHAGEALGAALFLDPETTEPEATVSERATLLQALRDKGFVDYEDETIYPAQAVVIVDGATDGTGTSAFKAENLANFAAGLNEGGRAVVLAGRAESAADEGAIGQVRALQDSTVTTVDSINRAWARLAAVLAVSEQLDGGTGHYGAASSADAAAPALPEQQ